MDLLKDERVETAEGFMPADQLSAFLTKCRRPIVVFLHYTFNGWTTGSKGTLCPRLPGVEKVILNQMSGLEGNGVFPLLLTGATDCRKEGMIADPRILVYPPIASGYFTVPDKCKNVQYAMSSEIGKMRNFLMQLAGQSVVAHNLTNCGAHNPVLGIAVKRFFDVDGGTQLYWVHDFRELSLVGPTELLPDNRLPGVKIICVSESRKRQMKIVLQEIAQDQVVDFNKVEVVPNPIDVDGFQNFHELPLTMAELAPDMGQYLERMGLNYSLLNQNPRALLFPEGAITAVVSARIVYQKHIRYAIRFMQKIAELQKKSTCLVVTGPPDPRKDKNRSYFQAVLEQTAKANQSPWTQVYLLCGVGEEYLSSLQKNASFVFAPFDNEGWGYVAPESALAAVPCVIVSR